MKAKKILLMISLLVVISCSGSHETHNREASGISYTFEFNDKLPFDVKDIYVKQAVVGDSVGVWIRIKYTEGFFNRLLYKYGFNECPSNEMVVDASSSANQPLWWDMKSSLKTYKRSNWKKEYGVSDGLLSFDESNHIIYFCHNAFN